MATSFQQQDKMIGFSIPKSAASPQHGQKAGPEPLKALEPRSYKPRPGH